MQYMEIWINAIASAQQDGVRKGSIYGALSQKERGFAESKDELGSIGANGTANKVDKINRYGF